MDRSRAPLNRRLVAGCLLLAAVLAAAAALLVRQDAPGPAAPSGLRISYEVEDLGTGTRTTEVVELERPLRSRRLSGETGSATTESGVFDRVRGGWRQLTVAAPGEVGSDLRPGAALLWAEQQALARRDGDGTVAGRRCTWWLTREPLDAGAFAPATGSDRARSCVDAQGLLLADTWRAAGSDLRRRTATQVTAARVEVLDGRVEPVPPGLVLLGVERLDQPVDDLVGLEPPPGLALVAAARVVELEPGSVTAVRRWVRAVYADADDLLVVDQLRGPLDVRGEAVDLAPLGQARVLATGGGLVLTVAVGPEQHVRVRTSAPYDVVTQWLAGMQRR